MRMPHAHVCVCVCLRVCAQAYKVDEAGILNLAKETTAKAVSPQS